jgi:hypothetical protein
VKGVIRKKLWTNDKAVLSIVEPMHNTIDTNLCTEARHRRCNREKSCLKHEPTCRVEQCKLAGVSYGRYLTTRGLDANVKLRRLIDEKVKKALNRLWKRCRPYILTVERCRRCWNGERFA